MPEHIPVLLTEAVTALQPKADNWYIDGTFGRGGHTRALLAHQANVIAFDVDQQAIEYGQSQFGAELAKNHLVLIRENFEKLGEVIHSLQKSGQVGPIHGALFDFGTSSEQLTSSERGFSFFGQGDLDMRMDERLGVKAKDLLMILPQKQLQQLFSEYGGEQEAHKIAAEIVKVRRLAPATLSTNEGLVTLIKRVKRDQRGHLHPATKVFQALRIAVNRELDVIAAALPQALASCTSPARIVCISFHEGEDRIVKHLFTEWASQHHGTLLTKHPVTASEAEIASNPRSRSAKLRIFEL